MRCVLVGNYGVGNVGDEALREYFLSAFSEVEWTVVSREFGTKSEKQLAVSGKMGTSVPRLPLGFRSLFRPWWKTIAAIARADAVVFGGGSLFTDVESVWACALWSSYALTAVVFRTPYILAFQGAGPWRTWLGRTLSKAVYHHAAGISVRDERSLDRVKHLKTNVEPVLSFDPAFALFVQIGKNLPSASVKNLVIIPRLNSDDDFFARASELAVEHWDKVVLLSMAPNAEKFVLDRLRTIFPLAPVFSADSVSGLLEVVSEASFVFTQRFHGALAALALDRDVEIVPQREGDKLDTLRIASQDSSAQDSWLIRIKKGEEALRATLKTISVYY